MWLERSLTYIKNIIEPITVSPLPTLYCGFVPPFFFEVKRKPIISAHFKYNPSIGHCLFLKKVECSREIKLSAKCQYEYSARSVATQHYLKTTTINYDNVKLFTATMQYPQRKNGEILDLSKFNRENKYRLNNTNKFYSQQLRENLSMEQSQL